MPSKVRQQLDRARCLVFPSRWYETYGLVVTEAVFTLPGVGRYLVDAIHHRDYTVIQAIVLIMAVIVSVANLAVDIIYGWVDPRVRYQ